MKVDPRIRELIKKHGSIEFRTRDSPFESLVQSIIGQQLNGQVARSIYAKLRASVQSEHMEPQVLHTLSASKLRKAGVSPQKIRYLKDLSARVVKGQLDLDDLRNRPDDEVVKILDEVRGIGPWTAHMFLLFMLGRTDVLPVDDLGIRTAIRHVYNLRQLPDAGKINEIARKWHP
ncbi:MAG: DNA-3-methyladenine glycosylase 2 family protein [archaeon]